MIYIQGDGSHMHSLTAYFFSVHNVYLPHKELLEIPRGERISKCKNVKEVISMKQKMKLSKGWRN